MRQRMHTVVGLCANGATADGWARRVQTSTFLSSADVLRSLLGDWSASSSPVPPCAQNKHTHCSEYVAMIGLAACHPQRGRRTQWSRDQQSRIGGRGGSIGRAERTCLEVGDELAQLDEAVAVG